MNILMKGAKQNNFKYKAIETLSFETSTMCAFFVT